MHLETSCLISERMGKEGSWLFDWSVYSRSCVGVMVVAALVLLIGLTLTLGSLTLDGLK